jgi:hypothetical protein
MINVSRAEPDPDLAIYLHDMSVESRKRQGRLRVLNYQVHKIMERMDGGADVDWVLEVLEEIGVEVGRF